MTFMTKFEISNNSYTVFSVPVSGLFMVINKIGNTEEASLLDTGLDMVWFGFLPVVVGFKSDIP